MPTQPQPGDLEMASQHKNKQTSFDITSTPLARRRQTQALPSIAGISQPMQQVPGDADRARRMQAQFDQPVTMGMPPSNLTGAGGLGAGGSGSNPLLAAVKPVPAQEVTSALASNPLAIPTQPAQPNSQGYSLTGVGAGAQGGEIAARRNENGVAEFSNDPAVVAGAQTMPAGGIGGQPLRTPGVSNMADDVPLAQRGSINNVGNGIGGGLSVGAPGDAALALGRFERANLEREKMIQVSRRGSIGEGGGRVTVVRDSSREPSTAETLRDRQDGRQAQTEALRAQTHQGIMAGADQLVTSQLNRQKTQQDLEAGNLALTERQRLADLGAQLANTEPGQRADVEREYLLRADPKAYLDQQAKAGIGQVELETKQLERDLLRAELDQGGIGGNIKLTEQQSKDLGYYTRGNEANAQLARQGDALTARATDGRSGLRGMLDTAVRGTPFVGDSALGNSRVSTERQQAEQSGRELLASILRKDTGAAITNQEMEIYGKMYLPQPGDSEEVLNQKAEARTRALASIRGGLGTAERKASPVNDGRRTAAGAPAQVRNDQDYAALPSGTT